MSPRFRQDEQSAARLMQMRLDSRGSPLRRTFIGNTDQYFQGRKLVEVKAKQKNIKNQMLSQGGQNIVQSQGLPTIGQNTRLTGKINPTDMRDSSRNFVN